MDYTWVKILLGAIIVGGAIWLQINYRYVRSAGIWVKREQRRKRKRW